MAKSVGRSKRDAGGGISITELLVSALLMTFVLAIIGEIVYLNTTASTKLTNKVDGQVAASRALRRIAEDIRSARIIGNLFSTSTPPSLPDQLSNIDPYSVTSPQGGWPSGDWPAIPYVLGPQTLILQQPTYFQDPNNNANPLNGFPLMQYGVPDSKVPFVECLDTTVYQLIPDRNNPGTYQLEVIRLPGNPVTAGGNPVNTTPRPLINPPQTILKGIIGPINAQSGTNKPEIFEYLSSPNGSFPGSTVSSPIVGVSINIEIQTPASGFGTNVQLIPVHLESYMKCASNLTMLSR